MATSLTQALRLTMHRFRSIAAMCWVLLAPSVLMAADCNRNGIEDDQDIAAGTSSDCDGDGAPDECVIRELDCNADGVPDLCQIESGEVADCNENSVPDECETLSRVDFSGRRYFRVSQPWFARSLDLDGDGRADILVGSRLEVFVFWSGDTPEAPPAALERIVLYPSAGLIRIGPVATGDIDGDGALDLCVVTPRGEVAILSQRTPRKFERLSSFPIAGQLSDVVVADMDGDDRLDLVLASADRFEVRRGRGDGTFEKPFASGASGGRLTTGDFDGDGDRDIVVVGPRTDVWANDGETFRILAVLPGAEGGGAAVADLDGDGALDVATGGGYIHWGDGRGSFESTGVVETRAGDVLIGDVDVDGILDVVWQDRNDVRIGRHDGNRGIAPGINRDIGAYISSLSASSNDVRLQLIVASASENLVTLHSGNYPDVVYAPEIVPEPDDAGGLFSSALGRGDIDGDGDTDLVNAIGYRLYAYENRDGQLELASTTGLDSPPHDVRLGDFNGDGRLDAVLVDGRLTDRMFWRGTQTVILPGVEGLAFSGEPLFRVDRGATCLAVADLDRDGRSDLVLGHFSFTKSSAIVIRFASGDDAVFLPPIEFELGAWPSFIEVWDYDSDGQLDIVGGYRALDFDLFFLRAVGDRKFEFTESVRLGGEAHTGRTGDIDGDGLVDLVVGVGSNWGENVRDARLTIVYARGGGELEIENVFRISDGIARFALADLDGDGDSDLVAPAFDYQDFDIFVTVPDRLWLIENRNDEFEDEWIALPGEPAAVTTLDLRGSPAPEIVVVTANGLTIVETKIRLGLDPEADCEGPRFVRGDVNSDGFRNLSDAIASLKALFDLGPKLDCPRAADANDDERFDIADPIFLLNYLFLGGRPPRAPVECGRDPTPGLLICPEFRHCV